MPTHVITALQLNLRSAPDPTRKNVIAVLAQGTPVTRVADSGPADWMEVAVALGGSTLRGHLNAKFLGPIGTTFPTASVADGRLPPADLGARSGELRAATGTRAHSILEAGKPGRPSADPGGRTAGIVRIIDWLDVGNADHVRWEPVDGKTFCNVYAYDVCDTAGCYLPRVWWTSSAITALRSGQSVEAKHGDTVFEMRANAIFNWLVEFGAMFGWKRVFDVDALQSDANAGRIAVICAQRSDMEKPGHIQIVAPENGANQAKRSGGVTVQPLQSNAGARNFTYGFMGPTWWQGPKFRQFGFWTAEVG